MFKHPSRTMLYTLALAATAACGDNTDGGNGDPTDAARTDGAVTDGAPATDGTPAVDGPVAIDATPTIDAPIDAAPVSDLILRYAFEDTGTTVTDGSGRGMNGTLSDVAAWNAAGRTGRGLALGGGNPATQFVTLPNGVLTGIDAFTIATWVKVDENTAWTRIYDIGNGMPDPAARFMFMTISGFTGAGAVGLHTTSYGGAPANENMLSASASLPTGVWKHIALTGVGGDRHLYVDGFPVASVVGGPSVPPGEMEPLAPQSWIGKSRFPDPGLHGSLDEFRIYNRQLSASELQDLAWPGSDYDLWRFDDGTGTVAVDSADQPIGAVLAGGATWTTEGRLGGAVVLGGGTSGQHVALSTSPLAGCTDQVTVAAWVKMRAMSNWSRLFDFGVGTSRFMYLAPTDGAGMHFAMVAPTGVFDLVSATQPLAADGMWHHVAVTVDASMVRIYADGVQVAAQASPAVRPGDFAATTDNFLGKSQFNDAGLDGAIDELRVACRAYTADEIEMLSHR
jgi:hypothetical protein